MKSLIALLCVMSAGIFAVRHGKHEAKGEDAWMLPSDTTKGRANPNVRRLERQDREHRRNVERLANGFPGEPDYNTKPNFGLKPRIHGENQRTVAPRKPRK